MNLERRKKKTSSTDPAWYSGCHLEYTFITTTTYQAGMNLKPDNSPSLTLGILLISHITSSVR